MGVWVSSLFGCGDGCVCPHCVAVGVAVGVVLGVAVGVAAG